MRAQWPVVCTCVRYLYVRSFEDEGEMRPSVLPVSLLVFCVMQFRGSAVLFCRAGLGWFFSLADWRIMGINRWIVFLFLSGRDFFAGACRRIWPTSATRRRGRRVWSAGRRATGVRHVASSAACWPACPRTVRDWMPRLTSQFPPGITIYILVIVCSNTNGNFVFKCS